ncbi:hypothetical protein L207DRAFT_507559 [Hyaloscypha variabilis F]|uniref:VASt domain-containing protein n=1 Tax=Hyaloscypha variabilis (strain UAMH 11265 / GT02V1 / F) TaxID=1149755 RepID=A0A2J6S7D1_HYAVF|nr:hypothetical protein L207DRAFT_507559 [Hyaloscypha variabilis F]
MTERPDSPTRNGLAQIFSKTRNRDKKGRDSAGNSIKSSDDSVGLRGAAEDAIEKMKGSTSTSTSTEDDADSNGIKKLVPKAIGSKRRQRKKEEEEEEQRESEEAARGRSVADRGTLRNDGGSPVNGSGDGSSLITYDSDTESPLETPPTLSTHPSHIGYLTTSSPLVHSKTLPELNLADAQVDGAPTPRAATFPPNVDLAAFESAPSLLDKSLRAPTNGSQKRSPSPVGRIRDAFKPRRGSSPSRSPERKPGGFGVLKKENSGGDGRRGSVASRVGSIFADRQSSPLPGSATNSPERPRTAKVQHIDTNAPPQTPPPGENTAPLIVNTPPTPTDTSSPRFEPVRERGSSDPATSNPNVITSASGNMISHRRIRSGSATLGPSKLSNITSAPLTPTPENGSTTPGSGGFFSTVFSAAQNAANTLSNSIANTSVAPGGNRSRSGTQDLKELKEVDDPVVETLVEKTDSENPSEEKELAVKTLGMGDLSLSALGISENSSGTNTPIGTKFSEEPRGRSEFTNDDSRNATSGLSSSENFEPANTSILDDIQPLIPPRSIYEPSVAGEQTPPNGSLFEGKAGLQRSGSIRSAIGGRRKRGSSAATGTTIGAAIAAAHASVAQPTAGTPKITGFAVASKKRNRDFHNLFRSVPDDDYLIEDYSCALQREILAHGRLYVSEGHLCFSSNIFGWVTTLVMSFDEIVSVEKRSTALVFKNGLMISTLHAKNIFASFTSRDSTYDLIVGIWKLGHPSLRSSLNGVRIEETGGGDKTEKDDGAVAPPSQSDSESGSDEEDGDEIYDEDEDDEDGMSFTQAEGSVEGSDIVEKSVSRKPSAAVVPNGTPPEKNKEDAPAASAVDFPGPATHAPTNCTDQDTHYTKVLADEVIPAPLGKVYSLMFGQASLTWMRNWLTVEQKCLELTMDDKKPLGLDNKVRNYSYIKPLNGAIGPKQTKCICTENLDSLDFEKAVSVTISTQTPDVPSGNVFSVKTKYCLSWAEGNGTRLQMSCTIEWTGKSWLKGPIEKGANDGQVQYSKDIVAALKAAVSSRRGTATITPGKGKKKGRKGRESKSISKQTDGASDSKPTTSNWGLFEPVHSLLEPLVDIVGPLLTGNILYGLLVGLLVASWFGFGFSGKGSGNRDLGMGYFGTPERVAAYEEVWRREESELWEWLEDRVGMDRLRDVSKMPIEARSIQDKLKEERMNEREMDAAIRVTEEKLRVLKASVEKSKAELKLLHGDGKGKSKANVDDNA